MAIIMQIQNEVHSIQDALIRLECLDSRRAYVARMRIIGRLSPKEISLLLGLEEVTVEKYWRFAKAWLAREVYDVKS
jgi:DNA-directed RNA polymerase specialized sigma24 family protein